MMGFWIKDPKTGKKSATLTIFMCGFIVALFKLFVSGMTLGGFSFEVFSGADFAAVVGAAGAIYGFRKYSDRDKQDPDERSLP